MFWMFLVLKFGDFWVWFIDFGCLDSFGVLTASVCGCDCL